MSLAQNERKIVKMWHGLPITAKILRSLLCSEEDVEEWENISNNKIWELSSDKSSNILPAYHCSHLPSPSKGCFTYYSIFPEGFEIEKWDLIYLWMTECILPQPKTENWMENVDDEYLGHFFISKFIRNHAIWCMALSMT